MISHRGPITVRLDSFEGPLDLLLYLIQSNELDISKVSLGAITDQYLSYVLLMQELDFDAASEFLVMSATLLHWKSRALLPQEEKASDAANADGDGPLTQEELVRQLIEHQKFRQAGANLLQLPWLGIDVFSRANSKPPVEKVWRELNITDLAMSYQEMLVRARKRSHILRKETVSIGDKIKDFADRLQPHERVEIRALLESHSRTEIVATFLAALELARLKKMTIYQEKVYSEIYLELLEALTHFDLHLATGFDNPNQPAPTVETLPQAENAPPLALG